MKTVVNTNQHLIETQDEFLTALQNSTFCSFYVNFRHVYQLYKVLDCTPQYVKTKEKQKVKSQ